MSLFGPDFEAYLRTPEPGRRALTEEQLRPYLEALGGDVGSKLAGVTVTPTTANSLPTWWAAVSLISGSVARSRVRFYRLDAHDIRRYDDAHYLYRLLNVSANALSSAFMLRRTLQAHALVYGNGYAEIEWDGAGRAVGLWLLSPLDVEPVLRGGRLVYLWRGVDVGLRAGDVLHVAGLGFDGVKGYSVLSVARQTIGLGLAAQKFGSSFFANGAWPGLVASTDQKLTPDQRTRITESWRAIHGDGPDKAHRMAVLEGGLKVEKLTIPPNDAQFLETQQFNVAQICQFFPGLHPSMLGFAAGAAPGGNYESQKVAYVSDCVGPWGATWEQEVQRKLVVSGPLTAEHDFEPLLALLSLNDTRLRNKAATAAVLVNAGFDPEDVVDVVGLPQMRHSKPEPAAPSSPAAGPGPGEPTGDVRVHIDGQEIARVLARTPREVEVGPRALVRRVTADVVARMTRLEGERARRAAAQGPAKFEAWLAEFYPAHEVRLREALEPVVRGWCELRGAGDWQAELEAVAAELVARSREELLDVKAAALEADVDARVSRWERERPAEAAELILGRMAA